MIAGGLVVMLLSAAASGAEVPPPVEFAVLTDRFRQVEAPFDVDEGPLDLHVDGGWLVPIAVVGPTPDIVGFVWIGDGEATLSLTDRADAQILANGMVRELGAQKAEVAALADGAPLVTRADAAIVLSISPEIDALFPERGPDSDDPLEVTIYGDRDGRAAARQAARLWSQRSTLYDELGVDVLDQLGWDRALAGLGAIGEGGRFRFVDVSVDQRFPLASGGFSGRSWVTAARSEDVAGDPRRRVTLTAMGRGPGGIAHQVRIGGEPFPTILAGDEAAAVAPAVRFDVAETESDVEVTPSPGQGTLSVDLQMRIVLRAVGGPVHHVVVHLPRADAEPGSWSLVGLQLDDGAPRYVDAPTPGEVRIVLPEAVPEGETVGLTFETRDTWPFLRLLTCRDVEHVGAPTSGAQPVAPLVLGSVGTAATSTVSATVPSEVLSVVVPGAPSLARTDGWTEASTADAGPQPAVTVGAWARAASSRGVGQIEGVDARLHDIPPEFDAALAGEVRRVGGYLGGWLPAVSAGRVTISEGALICPRLFYSATGMRVVVNLRNGERGEEAHNGFDVFEAPLGCGRRLELPQRDVIELRPIRGGELEAKLDPRDTHRDNAALAHDLAHQVWGHVALPASPDDFWLVESLSEVYACMYVGAAFGEEACDAHLERAREHWERFDGKNGASLTSAHLAADWDKRVWLYGPYVFLKMLRPRLGDGPFFLALDLLPRDHAGEPVTTERLQQAFEATSGQDLSDFFDFWVHQADIPRLALQWSQDDVGRVEGTLTADVPFGRFDVPVQLRTTRGEEWVTVDVVDGEGSFAIPDLARVRRVEIDPDGTVLARDRNISRRPPPDR